MKNTVGEVFMDGIFISFEGVEGSGKTTQAKRLHDHLAGKGNSAMLIREPGGTAIGEQIRGVLLDRGNAGMNDYTECCLYAAARAQLVSDVIGPALEEGKIVLCDRFVDSSYAYQAMARGLGFDAVFNINQPAVKDYMPHITVFIDIKPEEGLARRGKTDKFDRIDSETLDFHKKVYAGYEELIRKFDKRFLVIDGTGDENKVFARMLDSLGRRLSYMKKEVIL